jgi:hypothetical protein
MHTHTQLHTNRPHHIAHHPHTPHLHTAHTPHHTPNAKCQMPNAKCGRSSHAIKPTKQNAVLYKPIGLILVLAPLSGALFLSEDEDEDLRTRTRA